MPRYPSFYCRYGLLFVDSSVIENSTSFLNKKSSTGTPIKLTLLAVSRWNAFRSTWLCRMTLICSIHPLASFIATGDYWYWGRLFIQSLALLVFFKARLRSPCALRIVTDSYKEYRRLLRSASSWNTSKARFRKKNDRCSRTPMVVSDESQTEIGNESKG